MTEDPKEPPTLADYPCSLMILNGCQGSTGWFEFRHQLHINAPLFNIQSKLDADINKRVDRDTAPKTVVSKEPPANTVNVPENPIKVVVIWWTGNDVKFKNSAGKIRYRCDDKVLGVAVETIIEASKIADVLIILGPGNASGNGWLVTASVALEPGAPEHPTRRVIPLGWSNMVYGDPMRPAAMPAASMRSRTRSTRRFESARL